MEKRRRNFQLTRLLSYWNLFNSLSADLNQLHRQLAELKTIKKSLRKAVIEIKSFCKRQDRLSSNLESTLEPLGEIVLHVEQQRLLILTQIDASKEPLREFQRNKELRAIFKANKKSIRETRAAGWYFAEFSSLFRNQFGNVEWSKMHSFLKVNPTYNPGILRMPFTKETIKERVVRYEKFRKKNRIAKGQQFSISPSAK